jgi:uncharacterized protein (TIGR03000 family)
VAAALGLLLVVADTASAQRFFGRRGWGGGYYGGGYYGGMGYGNYGYGSGYLPGWGYGAGYSPGYNYGFRPSYGYSGAYYAPGYVSSGMTMAPGTTSFYYQPGAPIGAAGYGASATDPNAATIDVRVPPDAQVWFDGDPTSQRGSDRVFSSPPLEPGKTYHYNVRVRFTQNGQPVERTRRVEVRAGQRTNVDFNQDQGVDRDRDRDLNRDRNTDLNRNRNSDLNRDRNNDLNRNRSSGTNRNPDKPD